MLHLEHEDEAAFDLVVGSDGACSEVRPVLSDVRPAYSGIGGFELVVYNAAERYPDIARLIGRGSCCDYKGLQGQRTGNGRIAIYAFGKRAEDWADDCDYDTTNIRDVKKALLNEYADWAGVLQDLIRLADDEVVSRQCTHASCRPLMDISSGLHAHRRCRLSHDTVRGRGCERGDAGRIETGSGYKLRCSNLVSL